MSAVAHAMEPAETFTARPSDPVEMSGLRAGAIVFVGVGFANLSNYLFHLLSARSLGPSSYSDVASLTAVATVLSLPLGGAQVFVARHVASARAEGRPVKGDDYVSGFAAAMFVAGLALTAILLALSPLLQRALSIGSLGAVIAAVLITAPAFLAPVMVGAAQGSHRFTLVALAIAAPSMIRVILAGGALAAGLGVTGVIAATSIATLIGVAIPYLALRSTLGSVRTWRPHLDRADTFALLPVLAGMLAITCLTTDDLIAAKVAFSSHEAGLYGGASLIGRVILYLPVAVVTVLLPKVSALASAGHSTARLFLNSLLATAAVCIAFTGVYAAEPHLIVRIAFGAKYQGAASLLWMFGVAMTLYSLLNVLLVYRMGRGETRTCWLLLVGTVLQIGVFAALHSTPRQLLTGTIIVAAVLLAAASVLPSGQNSSDPRLELE